MFTAHFPIFISNTTGPWLLMRVSYIFSNARAKPYQSSIVGAYIHRLHLSIDHALAVSYRRNMYDGTTAFVAHITLVKGVPFYGFYVGYKFFLKIYMFNPLNMTRLADLLRQGTIMKKAIQPYESHIQYLAQWMCDYNLYGCAYIDCKVVKFRSPVPDYKDVDNVSHNWHDRKIPISLISDESQVPRQSHCSIEVDVCVEDILNRLSIMARHLHHDFLERKHPHATDERLVASMASLWRDEARRRKARLGDTASSPFPPEVLVSVSADPRHSQLGGWIHEEEFARMISNIIEDEKASGKGSELSFDGFVGKAPLEAQVKTTFESVEDLFPENLANLTSIERASHASDFGSKEAKNEEVDVDENRVLSFLETSSPYGSDEDLVNELKMPQERRDNQYDEKIANEGTTEMTVNPEPIISGERNSGPFKGNLGTMAYTEAHGPTSSTELEALSIRNAGDYGHIDDDSFEIPAEYASDITYPNKRRLKRNPSPLGPEFSPKRRNLLGSKDFASIKFPERYPEVQHNTHASLKGQISDKDVNGAIVPFTGRNTSSTQQQTSETRWMRAKLFSQDGYIANSTNSHKISDFPIVEEIQAPETFVHLSQRNSSPSKNSQNGKTKSALYKTQTEKSSEVSSCSNKPTPHVLSSPIIPSSQILQVSLRIHEAFQISCIQAIICFSRCPPSASDITCEMRRGKTPLTVYQDVYYSDERDVPEHAREFAGREFKLESITVPYLPDFDATCTSLASRGEKTAIVVDSITEEIIYRNQTKACDLQVWEIDKHPPERSEVHDWLRDADNAQTDVRASHAKSNLSQIDGATQKDRHGFKYSQKKRSTSVLHETQYMSAMSLEIHINTRGNLVPNPEKDEIGCIFWCINSDYKNPENSHPGEGTHVGILALSEDGVLGQRISQQTGLEVKSESTELDIMNHMVDIVRNYDPDILTGYEVHSGSWGYIIERAKLKYEFDLCNEFSRMKSQSHGRFGKESDKWGFNHTSTIRVTGRHIINIWRAMRGELNLLQYTMENVVFHLLHRRIPHYTYKDLTSWYSSNKPKDLAKAIDYYVLRAKLDNEILEENELVARTSEQARLLGVDFFSVFSRGSQFKVESLMFRLAKPESFLLPSPSRKQVGQQNALECLPLVMEPQSAFYNSPLVVLDFQSLYPSVMIAYNYCYSTFLGRVVSWRGRNKMGFTDYQRQQRLLELFKDQINIAPNGVMYAKPGIRKSLLAKMLCEILETRVMVKSGMKADREDKTLQRLLNNRQLALKLIANVTYGYTSASFSGRMPCSEIADSIVQTGRETLEKAIALIHSVGKWGAEVVYGDTDSLFVYLKGRTKDEAFDIGEEIAKTITNMNPRPVKLKFEKVYFPCVLLAKKRYVGFKYESKTQKEPEFDAKGIETVRRDGTPAEQRIEEKALKILFHTADLTQVKNYFQKQCTKIMKGHVSIQDFCFAKEVKLGTYSDRGVPPPGVLISTKRMLEDPRAEPQHGERVPYVVITGAPGARLVDRCVPPEVLLNDDQNELDSEYYISKNIIPPLERIFNIMGANVRQWYDEMPKFQRIRQIDAGPIIGSKEKIWTKKTMESYMKSSSCLVCRNKLEEEMPICSICRQNKYTSMLSLRSRLSRAELKVCNLEKACRSCSSLAWGEEVNCDSKDCAVFYTRVRHVAVLRNMRMITDPVIRFLEDMDGGDIDW